MAINCSYCQKRLAVRTGRRVGDKVAVASAACPTCGIDSGWVPGTLADATAALAKLKPAATPKAPAK